MIDVINNAPKSYNFIKTRKKFFHGIFKSLRHRKYVRLEVSPKDSRNNVVIQRNSIFGNEYELLLFMYQVHKFNLARCENTRKNTKYTRKCLLAT